MDDANELTPQEKSMVGRLTKEIFKSKKNMLAQRTADVVQWCYPMIEANRLFDVIEKAHDHFDRTVQS